MANASLPFAVALYLATVMIPVGFFLGPIYMTPIRLLSFIITIPLSVMLFTGRFGRVLPIDVFFYVYVFWMAISFALSGPIGAALEAFGSNTVEFLGGYLIARAFIRTREQFLTLCKWLGILVVCTLPLTLYENITGNPIVISTIASLPGVRSEFILTIPARLGLERAQVLFAHPIHYGLFCSLAFSLTFIAQKDVLSDTRRILTSILIAVCTFLGLSSGAILAVALQIGLLVWYLVFRNVQIRWLLLLGLFVLIYVAIDLVSTRSPSRVFMSYASFSSQTAFYRGAINEWGWMNVVGNAARGVPGHPIFGMGMNEDWVRPWWMYSGSIDNFWLVLAIRSGIPGAAFVIFGYVSALWMIGRKDFDGDEVMLRIRRAWMFTFCGMTFTLLTVHVWTTLFSFVFFLLGAGLWMLSTDPRREQSEDMAEDPQTTRRELRYTRFPPAQSGTRQPNIPANATAEVRTLPAHMERIYRK